MTATTDFPSRPRGRAPIWLVVLVAGNLLLGLGLALYLANEYRHIDHTAELRTKNYNQLITANLDQLFSNIDVALRAITAEPASGPDSEARRLQIIDVVAQTHPEFRTLTVHDRNGDFVGGRLAPDGKPFSIAGRPYLDLLRNSPQAETIVAGPYLGRSNNRWSLVFVRRISAADGSFAGVALTGYAIERLASVYDIAELNEADTIVIRAPGHETVSVFPTTFPVEIGKIDLPLPVTMAMAQSPQQGFVARSGPGMPDGVERMFAYHHTATFRFLVISTSRIDQLFAGFHLQAATLASLLLAGWLVSYLVARRSLHAEAELAQRMVDIQALNEKLIQAQNQLLQSEKMSSIGQLAAGVAHEINNPLSFVHSNLGTLQKYVESLLEIIDHSEACLQSCKIPGRYDAYRSITEKVELDFLRDDVRQLLKESIDGAVRVRRIVQNLMEFSHVSEQEWQWADLHAEFESTLNLVWHEVKYKAEIERRFGELPQVYCITAQINQVFLNLLVNAAQAIEAKGVITLSSGVLPAANGTPARVWIEIADTGKGIAPEHLSRIFEPFFTTKPIGQGTGLGLSLAWGIVEKHHGELKVASTPGAGTRFRLILPVNPTPDSSETGSMS